MAQQPRRQPSSSFLIYFSLYVNITYLVGSGDNGMIKLSKSRKKIKAKKIVS
jgi:hypothetical protein